MGNRVFFHFPCLFGLFLLELCSGSIQTTGKLNLGFITSQMFYMDNNGMFLVSNDSNFSFGFSSTVDPTFYLLAVKHQSTEAVIWASNRGNPVKNSDNFVLDDTGNAYLQSGGSMVWSSYTSNKGVSALELLDSGNLVLIGTDGNVIWQSFSYPTDTLITNQEFSEGMKLISDPGTNNLTYSLEIKSGNMILSVGFKPPQPYWSMKNDRRIIINKAVGNATSAVVTANSWNFLDPNKGLLWQFIIAKYSSVQNVTWAAVLGSDGFITFTTLQRNLAASTLTRIPKDQYYCSTQSSCDPYSICDPYQESCHCPSSLPSCKSFSRPSCDESTGSVELVGGGDGLINYFALEFVQPFSRTTLDGCKSSCLGNCSCGVMFFEEKSGKCFFFNEIGSMEEPTSDGDGDGDGDGYVFYIKILTSEGGSNNHVPVVKIIIIIVTVITILCLLFAGFRFYRRNNEVTGTSKESSEEDNFLKSLPGMPIRFSYKELEIATNNFTVKLGQGGFGSVYRGRLPDGTRVAIKQLEGVGQGKKEFRSEVSIIGSIHHIHLVKLRGFCAEGSHRLLVYEYMANGSLEKWLFKNDEGEESMLDWDTRFNIALGTAKGLAYLHEECEVKIVHCDIKPENVLLDDNFNAKVSDFGLAKLMNREQSHVFTTLRGTRGYLAPEWITNYAISEKSDVYSYGMVLLELIGGRKSYNPHETSEKSHFPTYAFKMLEEGKLKEIIDAKLKISEEDEKVIAAIKVALWCIQDDMNLRPPMTKVVQMLEGGSPVMAPPTRLFSNFVKSFSKRSSTGPSALGLSGPR